MPRILLFFIGTFLACSGFGQAITGTVKDDQGKPLPGASIILKQGKDSSIVKIQATDAAGTYQFANIQPGRYFVNTSFTGYKSANSAFFDLTAGGSATVPVITIAKLPGNLKEVVVAARKPMVEIRADKTVLNVEGSINAVGQDALELLRKSPGVLVDKDDNLSLSGKNGVQVYIDGRPTPLSGADLAAYLKTLQSSSIEAIEIITNPSAKYDAAGNAGIINIRLKKNKSYGTNGSVNGSYAIGTYSKYNAGISLNNRNRLVNLFGNYNYNNGLYYNYMNLYRTVLDSVFDQRGTSTYHNSSHNFKIGLDYILNKKSTVGVMVNGNLSDFNSNNDSRTPISYKPSGQLYRVLSAQNTSKGTRNNVNANLNYRYADSSGHELNMDADYGLYKIRTDQYQPNYYFGPSGSNLIESRIYNMLAPTDIDIYTFKTDYEQNFRKGRLGLGGKVSYVNSNNDFERYNVITLFKTLDTLRSNRFNYKENINALYVNYNRQFKGFLAQAGVRMENTHAEGGSNGYRITGQQYLVYDSSFERNYTDFFPSAAVTFNKKPTSQFGIQYSRRIDRPAYQDLNPFEFKIDEYTFQKGNTQLRPQYTNSVSLTHMYKFRFNTKLTYSHVKDVFTQLTDTAERSKAYLTKKNLATQDIASLNLSFPFQYKWYSVYSNVNTYYSHYKADFGTGRKVDLDVFSVNLYQQHTFTFKKGWTGQLSGFYNSPSIWQGTFKSRRIWSLDAGVLKTVLKGQGTLKASVSDVFRTLKFTGESNFANQYLRVMGGSDSRQFKLNFTYRFGSNQVKAARQRKTGLDEENNRVGSQGGGVGN